MSHARPFLSVIVPAYQATGVLPQTLEALSASDLPREAWELIVVDDGSTDDTSLIASQCADVVIRLSGRARGPAYARNRGFEASRGEVLVFVDSDVCVHPDTLRRFFDLFHHRPAVDAAFGSYDTRPPARGLVSQYRNLLHHYVHQQHSGRAETFWAGLGAIRSTVFADIGMFNEWHYPRAQIEDIELGRRLRQRGHEIVLEPHIQGTHLKRWAFRSMLATDVRSRGVPWMWLILREGASPDTLNLKGAQKACTALAGGAAAATVAALVWRSPWPLAVAAIALAIVLGLNLGFYEFLRRVRGPGFALAAMPLHLLYYLSNVISAPLGWVVHQLFGEPLPPAEAQTHALVGVKTWPPPPSPPSQDLWPRKGNGSH